MSLYLVVFSIALILSALIYRFTWGLRKAPGQTRKTQIVMLCLLGSGLSLIGGLQMTEILLSKPVTETGMVSHLHRTTGKGAHSIFWVTSAAGRTVQVNASYMGALLVDGEMVRVVYLDRTADITSLQLLSGDHVVWSEKERGGYVQAASSGVIGLAMLAGAFVIWRKAVDGTA